MPLTYRKTAKGVSEIETRAHKLAPRLRNALILVDGKRTDQELRALILHQPVETVAWLLENGFIDVLMRETVPRFLPGGPIAIATTATLPPGQPPWMPAAAAPSAPPMAAPAAAPPITPRLASPAAPVQLQGAVALGPALEARRRDGLRLLNDQLGPAGQAVVLQLEQARHLDELRAALRSGAQTLNNLRGRDAAMAFVARFNDL